MVVLWAGVLVSVWDLGWSNSCDLLYPGRACFVSGSAVDPEVLVVWDYFILFYSQRNSCDLLYLDIALLSRCLLVFGIWDGVVHVTYCISGLVAALFNAKNLDSGCLLGLALLYPLLFAVKFM